MTTKTSFSVFEIASDIIDTDDLYEMVNHVEGIIARAFVGALAINDEDTMADIRAELDAIDSWKDTIDCCDSEGVDCEDSASFMSVFAMA